MDRPLRKRFPAPGTPPPNAKRQRTRILRVPDTDAERENSPIVTRTTTTTDQDLDATKTGPTPGRLFEFEDGTWEWAPPPPRTQVDRTKGILRYREPGETYRPWPGPRKRVNLVANHRTRYYCKDSKEQQHKGRRKVNLLRPTTQETQNEHQAQSANDPNELDRDRGHHSVRAEQVENIQLLHQSQSIHTQAEPEESLPNPCTSLKSGAEIGGIGNPELESNSEALLGNSENTQGYYQNSEEEFAYNSNNDESLLYSELAHCTDLIETIVSPLVSQEFLAGALLQDLARYGITTIGHLSSMKPTELQRFGLRLETVKSVLEWYHSALAEQPLELQDDEDEFEEYVEVEDEDALNNVLDSAETSDNAAELDILPLYNTDTDTTLQPEVFAEILALFEVRERERTFDTHLTEIISTQFCATLVAETLNTEEIKQLLKNEEEGPMKTHQ